MSPRPLDLFGEVPVSESDIAAWMRAIPGLDPSSPRYATYVRDYQVIAKIREAKINGTFYAAIAQGGAPSRLAHLVGLTPRPPAPPAATRARPSR